MAKAPPPRASTPPENDGSSDRLDCWKDIAAYLHRDVSTVQRWEKREGMPVHRHLHEKLGTVYAFRPELDAWWRSRGAGLARQERREETRPPGDLGFGRVRPILAAHSRLVIVAMVGLAVTVTLAIGLQFNRDAEAQPDPQAPAGADPADLLLQARYLNVRTTHPDNRKAIELLEQAIELAPGLAPAYAQLASAYVTRLAYVRPDEKHELEQKAFAVAEKALSLDPNVPEAYLARGDLLWTHSHRFAHEMAVKEFRHALRLNPRSDETHRRLARVFVHVGFFDHALRHADTALSLNPSNGQALNSRAQALLWMGKDEEALAILRSIPGPVLPELVDANVVFALLRLGRREEASSHLQASIRKYPAGDPTGNLQGVEALLYSESDPARAEPLIDAVRKRKEANPSHHGAYFAACALARMGRARVAVEWLREAAATGFPCYPLFARDPNLDPIRADPRFRGFMAELQKASASLRRKLFPDGNWPDR